MRSSCTAVSTVLFSRSICGNNGRSLRYNKNDGLSNKRCKESLLGRVNPVKLGIVEFHLEGSSLVRKLTISQKEAVPGPKEIVSRGMS